MEMEMEHINLILWIYLSLNGITEVSFWRRYYNWMTECYVAWDN
jgi:hypothetical protein